MSRLLSQQKVLIKLNAFNKLMPRLKKKETVKLHLKLSSINRIQINANKKKDLNTISIAWDQAPHWGKKEKNTGVGEKRNLRAKRAEW